MNNGHKALKFLGIVFLAVIISNLFVYPSQSVATETKYTVSVSETSMIYTEPDLAVISFSVINEDKTVLGALKENAKKMNAVIDFVKNQGVQKEDLRTAAFSIFPLYEVVDKYSRKQVLVGYRVQQTLQVKIRNFKKIGEIISGAVNAGANRIGGLQFMVENQEELIKQARAEAIIKAKKKAQELATQVGFKLGKVVGFSESGRVPRPQNFNSRSVNTLAGDASPQIESGENVVSVTVTITYEID